MRIRFVNCSRVIDSPLTVAITAGRSSSGAGEPGAEGKAAGALGSAAPEAAPGALAAGATAPTVAGRA